MLEINYDYVAKKRCQLRYLVLLAQCMWFAVKGDSLFRKVLHTMHGKGGKSMQIFNRCF